MGQEMGASAPGAGRGKVGVVASSAGALHEVVCLLARQGIVVAQGIGPNVEPGAQATAGFLAGLQALQDDPEVEVVVAIVSETRDIDDDQVLSQVHDSNRPAVVCLLGGDASRVWQAGAIPARRLDEAAHRAAAWVRGWDQALVSSQLAEQDEELAAMAAHLRPLLGRGRRGIVGLFPAEALCREAWIMLGEVAGEGAYLDSVDPNLLGPVSDRAPLARSETDQSAQNWIYWDCVNSSPQRMSDALDDPGAGVILLAQLLERGTSEAVADDLVDGLALALEMVEGPRPLVIAHVYGTDLLAVERVEARLRQAGVTVVGSNAAAARLAGLVVST